MPSETVMVLKVTGLAPAASTPAAAKRASSSMCILQGVRLLQVDAMPTCGFSKSASPKPTARSIARLGVCFTPSTTSREKRRLSMGADFTFMPISLLNPVALRQVAMGAAQGLRLGADAAPGAVFGIPGVQI